ncbi:hypothetical protein D3C81_2019370 [compost metagenome]
MPIILLLDKVKIIIPASIIITIIVITKVISDIPFEFPLILIILNSPLYMKLFYLKIISLMKILSIKKEYFVKKVISMKRKLYIKYPFSLICLNCFLNLTDI